VQSISAAASPRHALIRRRCRRFEEKLLRETTLTCILQTPMVDPSANSAASVANSIAIGRSSRPHAYVDVVSSYPCIGFCHVSLTRRARGVNQTTTCFVAEFWISSVRNVTAVCHTVHICSAGLLAFIFHLFQYYRGGSDTSPPRDWLSVSNTP
jgi:hypothetical protein